MVRSVTVVLILTAVACVCAAPGQRVARVANNFAYGTEGSVSRGYISGGNYGPGAFSVGRGGNAYGAGDGGNAYGAGDGGHGGNIGNSNHGGSGDTGRITHG